MAYYIAVKKAPDRIPLLKTLANIKYTEFFKEALEMDLNDFEDFYIDILNNLKPGLSQILVHLGYDDSEMKKITIDHPNFGSKWRSYDFNIVSSKRFKNAFNDKHSNVKPFELFLLSNDFFL